MSGRFGALIFQRRNLMSILSNTVSVCQFQVAGSLPTGDLFEWAAERLAKNSFQSIDQTAAESSFGWVHFAGIIISFLPCVGISAAFLPPY
jgi:hypothetical protein